MGAMGRYTAIYKAGGRGVEPLFADPESVVLPLDEPPIPAGGILPCQIYSV
jgi:hypothetical protein